MDSAPAASPACSVTGTCSAARSSRASRCAEAGKPSSGPARSKPTTDPGTGSPGTWPSAVVVGVCAPTSVAGVPPVTASSGFPDGDDAARTLIDHGADMIELGLPYSDPVMDGPVIQAATTESLAHGFRVSDVFTVVRAVHLVPPASRSVAALL